MLVEDIKNYIKKNLSEKRYIHSLGVAETAEILSKKYNYDEQKAYFAGIAHDLAKEIPEEEMYRKIIGYGMENLILEYPYSLLHGPCAALILKNEFSVNDEEILDAVFYHTTGKENMNILTKIVYIADFIEPNRKYTDLDIIREKAFINIDDAIIAASGITIIDAVNNGRKLHKDTVLARNFLLK